MLRALIPGAGELIQPPLNSNMLAYEMCDNKYIYRRHAFTSQKQEGLQLFIKHFNLQLVGKSIFVLILSVK